MRRNFFNILNNKFTVGLVITNIGSFIFAIVARQSCFYLFDVLPVRGELGSLDITFLGLIFAFRIIVSAFVEVCLEDKYHIPILGEIGVKSRITFNMDNTQGSSGNTSASTDNPQQSTVRNHGVTWEQNDWAQKNYDRLHINLVDAKELLKEVLSEHNENVERIGDAYQSQGKSPEVKHHINQAEVTCDLIKAKLQSMKYAADARREALVTMKNYHLQSHTSLTGYSLTSLQDSGRISALVQEAESRIERFEHAMRNNPKNS